MAYDEMGEWDGQVSERLTEPDPDNIFYSWANRQTGAMFARHAMHARMAGDEDWAREMDTGAFNWNLNAEHGRFPASGG